MLKNKISPITGYSIILMALISIYAFGIAMPIFNKLETISDIYANLGTYKNMVLSIVVVLLLDILVSWSIFILFKSTEKHIASITGVLRFAYTFIFFTAFLELQKVLQYDLIQLEKFHEHLHSFSVTWNAGLILFGFHLTSLAYLIKLEPKFPKWLYHLVNIAGVSYILVHLLKLSLEGYSFMNYLELILTIPMALGELVFAVYIIVKPVKKQN